MLRHYEVTSIMCKYSQTEIQWSDGKKTIKGTFNGQSEEYSAGADVDEVSEA